MVKIVSLVLVISLVGMGSTFVPQPTAQLGWNRMQAYPFNPIIQEQLEDAMEEVQDAQEDAQEAREDLMEARRPLYFAPQWIPTSPATNQPIAPPMTRFYCSSKMLCPPGTKLMPVKTALQQMVQCICVKTIP